MIYICYNIEYYFIEKREGTMKKIHKNREGILIKRYKNEKATRVKVKRVENYSEVLLETLEKYGAEIEQVIVGYNKSSVDKPMALSSTRNSSRKIQNRKTHQEMVELVAVEIAKKLGLSVGVTRVIAKSHDIGHTFFGHNGEIWISNVKKEYGLGVYTHSSLGPKELIYRYGIYDKIIEEIRSFNPEITQKELTRLRKGLWIIFDGINSHNGELSETEVKPNFDKTELDFNEEIMKSHTCEGFDRSIMPATIEGSLMRMCDKIAYSPFDMVDGLYEGMIDKIDGEYIDILTSLGITSEEIDMANRTKNYEGIARKLQIIFSKSVIENSTDTSIRMDKNTSKLMHELRNVNNKRIVNLQILKEEQEIYPTAIRMLMNRYADLLTDNFFNIEDLRNISANAVITHSIMRKFEGTVDEGFVRYIIGTTPDIYDFNKIMIEEVSEEEKRKGKFVDIDFDRKMALEFGAEYISTLGDFEFLNLLEANKLITEEQKRSLTRTYRQIGREGLIEQRYIQREWQKRQAKQAEDTAKIGRKTEGLGEAK